MDLDKLEEGLKEEVVDQDHAVEAVIRAVTVAEMGVCDPARPLGTFLFLGPTGVGKSQLPRSLAKIIHGDEKNIVVVNGTEFKNPHDVAKLVGAPPGYVGHEQPPFITQEKIAGPMSVVLLEEIEKADKAFFDLLLQVLERGELKTGRGAELNFNKCFIFATSNEGTWETDKWRHGPVGFSPLPITPEDVDSIKTKEERIYLDAAENRWSPEFLNRFDEVVVFGRLKAEYVLRILDKFLLEVQTRFCGAGVAVIVTPEAKKFLIAKGTNLRYGARPLKRAIRKYLEFPLSKLGVYLTKTGVKEEADVVVDSDGKRLTFLKKKFFSANGG